MNTVFQNSEDSVQIPLFDEHSEIPRIEEEKRADEVSNAQEIPPTDAWTPTADYYLG